jgi:trehalose 6-phosphate phosphatase
MQSPVPLQSNGTPPPELPNAGDRWAFFLDVDGTLLEIAATPESVIVRPRLVPLLTRLRDAVEGALALVSGRTVAELDALFTPERFVVAGIHGAQLRSTGDALITSPDLAGLDPAREMLATFTRRFPGVRMEDKGLAIAVHYRSVPQAESAVRDVGAAIVERLGSAYEVLFGRKIVEIRRRDATKGHAVTTLLEAAPFRGRRPVYLGDDLTDEDAFGVVNDAGGLSVLVGGRIDTRATRRLVTVTDVHRWLEAVTDRLADDG